MQLPSIATFPNGRGAQTLAKGLGWFSIGLGVMEVVAPRTLARFIGMHGRERLIQSYGVREVVNGIGLVLARDPAPWMLARVAGDGLDLTTLRPYLSEANPARRGATIAAAAVGGIAALDVACTQSLITQRKQAALPVRDYSDRSGFPKGLMAMRGVASDHQPASTSTSTSTSKSSDANRKDNEVSSSDPSVPLDAGVPPSPLLTGVIPKPLESSRYS